MSFPGMGRSPAGLEAIEGPSELLGAVMCEASQDDGDELVSLMCMVGCRMVRIVQHADSCIGTSKPLPRTE